jgi:DNA polymerase-3 subunit epsilon
MNSRFAIIDFETTGRSPSSGDRIIEVGAVIVESDRIVDQFQSLVNSGKTVPFFIEGLTGITNQMVAKAPPVSSVIPALFQFIKHTTPVAHNASFDSMFLHNELGKAGIILNFEFVCTLLLSKRLYPSLENKKLATLARHHGIKFQGKGHRALADAKVTAELFIQITNDLKKLFPADEITPQKLLMWQRQPINKFVQNPHQTNGSHRGAPGRAYFPPITITPSSPPKTGASPNTKAEKVSSSAQVPEKEVWIKTAKGLENKATGVLISFTNTLRDVFPVPGYKVTGHKVKFIKDSEIENLTSESIPATHQSTTPVKKNPYKRFLTDLEAIEKRGQEPSNTAVAPAIQAANPKEKKQERSWVKTPRGLYNKKTGNLISFADTLRDVFPTAGYRLKGFPIEFIKDSEIDPY